jgi:hypothetical protein
MMFPKKVSNVSDKRLTVVLNFCYVYIYYLTNIIRRINFLELLTV